MAGVTVPSRFETHLALGDGSVGADVSETLGLALSQVANLYSVSPGQFTYCFQVSLLPPALASARESASTGTRRRLWRDSSQREEGGSDLLSPSG